MPSVNYTSIKKTNKEKISECLQETCSSVWVPCLPKSLVSHNIMLHMLSFWRGAETGTTKDSGGLKKLVELPQRRWADLTDSQGLTEKILVWDSVSLRLVKWAKFLELTNVLLLFCPYKCENSFIHSLTNIYLLLTTCKTRAAPRPSTVAHGPDSVGSDFSLSCPYIPTSVGQKHGTLLHL